MNTNNIQAYACYTFENTTLTFYYDNQRDTRLGTTYDLNVFSTEPEWCSDGNCYNVTKVVFDQSFADARPTSTYLWFGNMINLETIEGMEYLNTSEVTNMRHMFASCKKLTSLDLNSFNTSKVTSMANMFELCSHLTSLDLSSFDTARVTDMSEMFDYCGSLDTLDLSSFNTDKLKYMDFMFSDCYFLRTIIGLNWRMKSGGHNMFHRCYNLVGGKGTTYNAAHVDAAYAHIDGDLNNPGYFTEK